MGIEEKTEDTMGSIRLVPNPYSKEGHPEQIWADTELDQLRRKECLCYNCGHKDDQPKYSGCSVSQILYALAQNHDLAMMISMCGAKDDKRKLLHISSPVGGTGIKEIKVTENNHDYIINYVNETILESRGLCDSCPCSQSDCSVLDTLMNLQYDENLIITVTRCGATDSEGNLLYKLES